MTAEKWKGILWDSAVEAFVGTILLLFLGELALSIVGGIWKGMVPVFPPIVHNSNSIELNDSSAENSFFLFARENRFVLVFSFLYLFVASIKIGLHSDLDSRRRMAEWVQQIYKRFQSKWFGCLVGNAFGALFIAMALTHIPDFSFNRWIFYWILEWLHPVIYRVLSVFMDASKIATIHDLLSWYDANYMRFTFWFFYSSAILDDLGIPNFKSLAHWLCKPHKHFSLDKIINSKSVS